MKNIRSLFLWVMAIILLLCSCAKNKTGDISSLTTSNENSSLFASSETTSKKDFSSIAQTKEEISSESLSSVKESLSEKQNQTTNDYGKSLEDISTERKVQSDALLKKFSATSFEKLVMHKGNVLHMFVELYGALDSDVEPVLEMEEKEKIDIFLDKLDSNKWIPKKYNIKGGPDYVIFLDKAFVIGLGPKTVNDIYWLSLQTETDGKFYYIIPKDTYTNLCTLLNIK